MFHMSAMNSKIPIVIDGFVAIIWKSETEELEDVVWVLRFKMHRSVQNQN
jgi:hypothetical protein